MTPRERWLAIFAREKPDRVPTDYWATDEVTARLQRELRCSTLEELYDKLNIDGVTRIEVPRTLLHHPSDPESDIWGLRRRKMDYGAGTYDEFDTHPLEKFTTVEEIHGYTWPSADDHDYDAFREMVRTVPRHRFVRCGEFEPFLLYCAMRGLEQGLMDFLEYPELLEAEEIGERIHRVRLTRRALATRRRRRAGIAGAHEAQGAGNGGAADGFAAE